MALTLRGGVYYAQFDIDGRRVKKSTFQTNKDEAQKVHDKILEAARKHKGANAVLKTGQSLNRSEWAAHIDGELSKGDGGFVGLLSRRAKRRAKEMKRECMIDYAMIGRLLIESGGVCTVTGAPLSFSGESYFKPSLDRIDNSRGYTLDNIRVTCAVANLAMNKWGEVALRKMCAHYIKKILLNS